MSIHRHRLPQLFALVLALVAVVGLTACASGGGMSDADNQLATSVQQAIDSDPMVGEYNVDVTVVDGVVILRGWVRTTEARIQAVDVARGVDGVDSVRNEIEIRI